MTVLSFTGADAIRGMLSPGAYQLVSSGGATGTRGSADTSISWVFTVSTPLPCYPNCDGSTVSPVLNVNDFVCFQTRFAAGDSYANCDGSTIAPILNVNDFICFQSRFAAGCSAP
jgi:hypothetical protein